MQATASFGFIEAYHRLVTSLDPAQRSAAFREGAQAARLYGATGAPTSVAAWEVLLAQRLPQLERSDIVFEFLDLVGRAEVLPAPLRPLQRLLVRAAVEITPAPVRNRLGLDRAHGLSRRKFALVKAMARLAERVPLRSAPPAQAAIRMGMSPDALYA